MFGGVLSQSLTLLILPMREELNISVTSIGLISVLAGTAGMVAGLLMGLMVDRFGSRPLILFGGIIAGLGLILFSQSDGMWQFSLTFALAFAGSTVGFSLITLLSTVNQWFARRRAIAMAVLMTVFAAGPILGSLPLAVGLASMEWRTTLLVWGSFLCALAGVSWLVVRSRPEDKGLFPDGDAEPPGTPHFSVGETIHSGAFWVLVLGGVLLNNAGSTTLEDLSPPLTVVGPLLTVLFTLGLGVAAIWFPCRKLLSSCLLVGALGHVALLVVDSDAGAVMFLAALAVVKGGNATFWIMAGDYFGRNRFGSIMGLMIFLRGVGGYVPEVIGAILDEFGYYDISLVFYVLIYAAIAVPVWSARRPPPPQRELADAGKPAT